MSRTARGRTHAPSTAESIRMASVSVLTTTTKRGVPVGSAIGLGSMMEENSELVAMNIAPIIISLQDILSSEEQLEILSMEWNLEKPPSPRVLPEQLLITGGSSAGVMSNACILAWERGIVDTFKIDKHITTVSKKLADIENAVENNQLDYEQEGLRVIKKFSDRLNRVTFVEMMDKRFQGSWDSMQLKIDQVDPECEIVVPVVESFTIRPPGLRPVGTPKVRFLMPEYDESHLLEHFKHRVLTPAGIEALAERIPEAGRAILSELNTYSYSFEEARATRVLVDGLISFMGSSIISPSDIDNVIAKGSEFMQLAENAIGIFEEMTEQHIGSGKTMKLNEHLVELNSLAELKTDELYGIKGTIIKGLLTAMGDSLQREFPTETEIRAWQLKSAIRYFVAYSKRAIQNFTDELTRFLTVSASREVLVSALREFKNEMFQRELDSIDKMLFEKIYDELFSQLNALFDKHAFKGDINKDTRSLLNEIADEMIRVFRKIDVWSLVDFIDIAEIARNEIQRLDESADLIGVSPDELSARLVKFEQLVQEVIPDVAQTLLSRTTINKIIDKMYYEPVPLIDEFARVVEGIDERSELWLSEAKSWLKEFQNKLNVDDPLSKQLLDFVTFVHEKLNTARGALAVIEKVSSVAEELEQEYAQRIEQWQKKYSRIEAENEQAFAHNTRRTEMIRAEREKLENEQQIYQARLSEGLSPSPPEAWESRLQRINSQYPERPMQQLPPRPEPPKEMLIYRRLRQILTEKIEKMGEQHKALESTFTNLLVTLKTRGIESAPDAKIELGDAFYNYLIEDVIRGLSHIFPYITRVYLRDPNDLNVMYLVSYERKPGELRIIIGNNFLRGEA